MENWLELRVSIWADGKSFCIAEKRVFEGSSTFAKMFILNGGDPFRLQKILGHADILTTKEYVEMFGQDLLIGFDRFNPLDNLKSTKRKIAM